MWDVFVAGKDSVGVLETGAAMKLGLIAPGPTRKVPVLSRFLIRVCMSFFLVHNGHNKSLNLKSCTDYPKLLLLGRSSGLTLYELYLTIHYCINN